MVAAVECIVQSLSGFPSAVQPATFGKGFEFVGQVVFKTREKGAVGEPEGYTYRVRQDGTPKGVHASPLDRCYKDITPKGVKRLVVDFQLFIEYLHAFRCVVFVVSIGPLPLHAFRCAILSNSETLFVQPPLTA